MKNRATMDRTGRRGKVGGWQRNVEGIRGEAAPHFLRALRFFVVENLGYAQRCRTSSHSLQGIPW